jgi:hypothetical protein
MAKQLVLICDLKDVLMRFSYFYHIKQLVSVDDLRDDQEYEDIYEDIKEECGKYGKQWI